MKGLSRKLKLKIPKTIQVGGYIYQLTFNKYLAQLGWIASHSVTDGRLDFNPTRSKQELNEAFYHEILHAIDNVFNHDEAGEASVDRFGHGLFQVFGQMVDLDWSALPTINEEISGTTCEPQEETE